MSKLPATDSVRELARFWDSHDLTELESELVEVDGPVFERAPGSVLQVNLPPGDAAALRREAESRGIADEDLVREWLAEKLHAS